MRLQNVGELRSHLSTRNLSPEQFARQAKVSHMTIRRMLRRKNDTPIADKYVSLFEHSASPKNTIKTTIRLPNLAGSFHPLIDELEQSGKEVQDLDRLNKDLKSKLKDLRIDKTIRTQVRQLLKSLHSTKIPLKIKAICIGALLYLINPVDMIPDAMPVVGYLDDFAVLTLAVAALTRKDKNV